jgi:serine/threonine protein kinase
MSTDSDIPRQLGEYKILEQIGSGPYCVVWHGRQKDGTSRALKVLAPRYAADSARLARFESEARLAQSFEHPHIVRVYQVVSKTESDLPYFVMDLLPGGNLGQFRGLSRQDFSTLIRLLIEIGSALDYLHQRGLVHCDVKPSNILLDGQRHAYLTDFGMTASPDDIEHTGPRGGTILYMSPEQFEGMSSGQATSACVGASSDVYSLGVLMYDLFTGEMPFKGSTRYSLMYKRMTSQPQLPSVLRPEISADLEAIILKAMARDATERFQTTAALISALKGVSS